MTETALERVSALAERWIAREGDSLGVALDQRVGRVILASVRDDGSTPEFRIGHVKRLAESWLKPGNPLFYPAAGQAVLDAINGGASPAGEDLLAGPRREAVEKARAILSSHRVPAWADGARVFAGQVRALLAIVDSIAPKREA